ncbi:hypothetical protein LY28_00852 [Ruminiclostridium sufflavum DSM 19573]|uniref:Uncharacterized protein n=1 Tax=Ruminiclostridium sufflavum DSM 19573 TaxID=1121337 RepID=A0A318XME8_9FIRM|nr:hypothetical protein [Ruminiclostridium sufflavum]PYG89032.1 hypothetical protein LY28_00852 [Ruminiclostridium sufflavum DSM 19573]
MAKDNIKPGRFLYAVSGLLFVAGIILLTAVLMTGVNSSVDRINNKVVVPGAGVVELKEPGDYSIYFEHRSVLDGRTYNTDNINGLVCKLKNAETGEYINLENPTINSRYSVNGREGRSLFQFSIEKAGKYELDARYESGEGEEAVLAIGKGFGMSLLKTMLTGFGTLIITIGGAIVIFVVTLKKRGENRNRN